MRLQDDLFLSQGAPAADVSTAGFHEVNGTLVFGSPAALHDFVSGFIHLHKTAWGKNGIHGQIFAANVAIGVLAGRELGQVGERNQSPLFDHASKVDGAAGVETGVQTERHLYRREVGQGLRYVRLRGHYKVQIKGHSVEVHAKPGHKLTDVLAVDGGEGIQTEDAGHDAFCFDIGKPAGRDGELIISMFLRDASTGVLDVSHRQTELLAKQPQTLSTRTHTVPLAWLKTAAIVVS